MTILTKQNTTLLSLIYISFFLISFNLTAQSIDKTAIQLAALQGKSSKVDSITISLKGKVVLKVIGEQSELFKTELIKGKTTSKVKIQFVPNDFLGLAQASIKIEDNKGKELQKVSLSGISRPALEGENEATMLEIFQAFGITTDPGWTTLANHIKPELQGEELKPGLFKKASNEPVEIIPLARYSPPSTLPFGFYLNSQSGPELHQVDILANSEQFHEHQTLNPAVINGNSSFDPGENAFGIYVVSPTHNSFQEDIWNQILFPDHAGHAVRVFPVKKDGKTIENDFLVCFEEAANGDYQDYVFLIKNVKPIDSNSLFTTLLQKDNLDGWYSFLETKGKNNDIENVFTVKDGLLHDTGKEMGYIMTNNSYENYHFKLQFKWGEKKWPPRDSVKRDSGICYHIPDYEDDHVWPLSVECQIQEGDVGDFWLLGYSTIEVNGLQNEPRQYSSMVKSKDNELPNGQWNTVEVLTYNGICVHLVNGVVVNYGTKSSLRKGRILLQSELAEIYYRNVEIREF